MASLNNLAGTRCHRTGGDRHIIGAVDGDGDGLINEGAKVIGDACGVALRNGLAFSESLRGGEGVIEGVGPDPCGGVDGDGAVGGGGSVQDGPGLGSAGVEVGGAKGPRNAGASSQQGSFVKVSRFNDGAHVAGDATATGAKNQLGGVVTLSVVTKALASPNSRYWVLGVDETPSATAIALLRDTTCARCSNGPCAVI